jgi:hypothetical protein
MAAVLHGAAATRIPAPGGAALTIGAADGPGAPVTSGEVLSSSETGAPAEPAPSGAAAPAGEVEAPAGATTAGTADRVVHRTDVRARGRTLGEIRVLRRGDALVVQTLLHTTILRQVVARIIEKEEVNWPPERAGHAAAMQYVAALRRARDAVAPRGGAGSAAPAADRRRALLIEFLLSPRAATVGLYAPALADGTITTARPLATLALARPYVERDLRLIVADNFTLPDGAIDELLRAVTPHAARTPGAPAPSAERNDR